jgi:molecular chaperone DnaK
VSFNIDANGILNVSAKDKGTGKEQSITISGSGNLSKEDVEKAAKEAEAHAEEDKKKRSAAEAKNILENAIYQADKMKTDYKDKLSEEDAKTIDMAVSEAKKAVESTDKEELEKAAKDLSDRIMPIGAKMYESAQAESKPEDGAKPEAEAGEEKNDAKKDKDEPIEGEVVDDKKDEK